MRWPRGAAWLIAVMTLVLLGLELTAVTIAGSGADQLYAAGTTATALLTLALAVLVSRRQPSNVVAPLLSWMALVTVAKSFSDQYLPLQQRHPNLLPRLPTGSVALFVVTWVWLYAAVALLMLYFPDGRLVSRRWRWVAGAFPALGIAIQIVMVVSPGPYDTPYTHTAHPYGELPSAVAIGLKVVLFPSLIAALIASVYSMRIRYRRGDQVIRAQLKWLALAGLALPATILLSWVGFLFLGNHNLAGIGFSVLYTAVPVATTIAILRHNLYDVDRALSATVTYSAVTASLLVVFTLASFVSGVVLGRHSVSAAAGVTAVTALAASPLRTRLQRRIDRRLYPIRRAALQAIDDLRTSITSGLAGPERLQDVLRVALRDPALRIGIALPGGSGFVDADGEPLDVGTTSVPINVRGQQIGAIAAAGPAPVQLLREIASASVMLVEMGRLRLELSAANRDVASSRSRLLRIGYEERRRLERDLHDGAQQRLVSLGMSLRLAQRHLGDNTVDVDGLLDESVAQLGTAVAELREVAHGLRPSCLDDGLHPALAALAESATLPIDLEVAADRAIPDDIATTAYYVVSEAVANALKHAEASRIGLRIVQDDGQLRVRIEDDGRGGATARPGSGLAGLSDRVSAAGGSLNVYSLPGKGTVVEAMLPCAS